MPERSMTITRPGVPASGTGPRSPVEYRIEPGSLSFEQWVELGRQLAQTHTSVAWWVGDWCSYGHREYGNRYEAALDATGLDIQTLRTYKMVAERFPAYRRRYALSFSHHLDVASLGIADQERWLQRAIDERWSSKTLRDQLRAARELDAPTVGDVMVVRLVPLGVKVEEDRRGRYAAAAEAHGLDLASWVRQALDEAAEAA